MEGGKEGVAHLFVKNQGKKAGCTSCTRTSDSVEQDAVGTRVPSWASAAGVQHVKGAQHLEPGSDLQLRDSKAGQEDAGQRRPQKSQWQEHNCTLTKSTFQGTYLEKDELVGSMHHHHSTCCPRGDSPMSVGEDSTAP